MSLQPIELISFKTCPFVQRSVITLLKKNIEFKITYIDLANKPDWFLEISPLGKVPVVKYGDNILFESAVINEFLDEITPDRLMPEDPLQKAKDRAWIEYISQVLVNQFVMSVADNQSDFEKHSTSLTEKLQRLETIISDDAYFNGANFSLVDTALAPLFTRFDIMANTFQKNFLADFPKLAALGKRLTRFDFVKKSVVDNFEEVYVDYLKGKNSYLTA
ncbi:glutathione S-transferase family protein [Aliikangiella coralliicola]|uniref:Glutathione-dependent dehydroascorbate reductase n=1 Tax=Aliikangiella coralliicola TaxID=2592383 RepID=A0A545UA54_9GAMM|nr:glutathione S-transferase family protein [Aliikangiella coralliicola]TQV86357.1 glutathione S-transferase family protein [Aliikangiella coralliicola]